MNIEAGSWVGPRRRAARSAVRWAVMSILWGATVAGAQVDLVYLGNEGFLLEAGETRVLVDALYGDGLKGYPVVPKEIRESLETGEGPFGGVDLVLATHHHSDHFRAEPVARFLRAQPEARFVSTRQAVEAVLALDAGLRDRLQGFWPNPGERKSLAFEGLELEILRLHHGKNRRPEIQNLGFVLELGGVRLLHVGDTEVSVDDVAPYALDRSRLDVALLPTWHYSADNHGVNELLGKVQRVVMHVAAEDAPAGYFYPAETLEDLLRVLGKTYPKAWVPTRALDRRTFRSRNVPAAGGDR